MKQLVNKPKHELQLVSKITYININYIVRRKGTHLIYLRSVQYLLVILRVRSKKVRHNFFLFLPST